MNRRRFLQATALGTAVGIAGCPEEVGTPSPGTTPGTTPTDRGSETPDSGGPVIERDGFEVELFAEFTGLSGNPRSFYMEIADGSRGYDEGVYVTSGPMHPSRPEGEYNRLLHVTPEGEPRVFASGVGGLETLLFGRGDWGDGLLATRPTGLDIVAVTPEGDFRPVVDAVGYDSVDEVPTLEEAEGVPFGPTGMDHGPDGRTLFVSDFLGQRVVQITPSGEVVASHGIGSYAKPIVEGAIPKRYGGALVTGSFVIPPNPRGEGFIAVVTEEGEVNRLVEDVGGLEFMTPSPGGAFGEDLFVANIGSIEDDDGGIRTLTPEGELEPFLSGLDPVHVAFDTEGVVGGGMLVSEFTFESPGRIYRVRRA